MMPCWDTTAVPSPIPMKNSATSTPTNHGDSPATMPVTAITPEPIMKAGGSVRRSSSRPSSEPTMDPPPQAAISTPYPMPPAPK
jgi:hypothetical protein